MAYKETFWMACDSTEQLRAEYGPFHTRAEAEQEARKLAFGYLLRYEHIIGDNEDIQEVRCIFVELPLGPVPVPARFREYGNGKRENTTSAFASCGHVVAHAIAAPIRGREFGIAFGAVIAVARCQRHSAAPVRPGVGTDDAAAGADHAWSECWHWHVIGPAVSAQDVAAIAS